MSRRSFDRIAKLYRVVEYLFLGGSLQRARVAHLASLAQARRILILGEGDGRFLQCLLRSNPNCEVTIVEASSEMTKLAQRRTAGDSQRTSFVLKDATTFLAEVPEPAVFDGVVTLFFLDCFDEPELTLLIRRLVQRLKPGGLWLYADFTLPSAAVARSLGRVLIAFLYQAFALLTDIRARELVNPRPILEANGLVLETSTESLFGLLGSAVFSRRG